MKLYKTLQLYILVHAILLSCTDKIGEQTDAGSLIDGVPEGNITIPVLPDRTSVIKNPLTGWVMYGSATDDPSYWDREIYVPNIGKNVKVIDYASACYIRTGWSNFNPEDNVYVWEQPDSKLYKMIKGAEERNMPIAFRIVVDGRDQGLNTPQFVFDAGADFYLENDRFPDRKTPYPTDPVFRKYYEKFVEALAREFNDPDKTAFIDAYGLGKWGEGHSVIYEPGGKTTDKTLEYANETMEWITGLYSKYFTKVPLVINYHRHIGYTPSDGAKPSPGSDERMQTAIEHGYCVRSDAFGMNNTSWGYGIWEKQFAAKCNELKIPIIMEGGWLVNSSSYWNDDAGYREGHPEDVRKGEYDASMEARVNMMDFRVRGETDSWFMDAFQYVQRFVEEGGYRLYPDVVSVPESVRTGDNVTVTSTWVNLGWGVCPVNLKQWDQKYKVAYALLDLQSGNPVKVFVDDGSDLSTWIKGSPVSYTFDIDLEGIPIGAYMWGIGIVDVTKIDESGFPEIGINMAVTAKMLTDAGWAKLTALTVMPK